MINQVVNSADKKVFTPLKTNGVDYAIAKPFTDKQVKEKKQEEEKKESNLGKKITKYSLLAGFGLLIILGGATPFGRKSFKNLLDKVGEKLRIAKNKQDKSVKEKLSEKILKGVHNILLKLKATYNLASLKDIAVKKGLEKVSFLDRAGQAITNLFEKISIKTSINAYNKTHKKLGKMVAYMDEIQAKIQNKLSEKEFKELNENRAMIIYHSHNFDIPKQTQRINELKKYFYGKDEKATNSLANRVWEKTWGHLNNFGLKSKMYDTFITEWLVKEKKLEFHNNIQASRVLITNDLRDTYSLTNRLMQELEPYHELKEGEGKKTIEKVKTTLERMKKRLNSKEEKRKGLLDSGLAWKLGEIKEILKNSNEKGNEKICESINAVVEILSTNTKGAVQRNLDIYKKYIKDEKEYEKVKKEIYKGVNSLHHSIKLEDELFDKIRDLSIGSAPKDTLAVLGSAGVVGWYLNKADNKDERISVALKYGIPTIGAVATALYCTVGLVSGGSSLIIGLLSGVAISKVGTYADYLRKKYQEKKLSLDNIITPTSILPTKYLNILAHDKSSLQPANKSSS